MTLRDLIPRFRGRNGHGGEWEFGITKFRRELDRLFEDFFPVWEGAPFGREGMAYFPGVDLVESDTAFTVKVEIPGMDEKDIEVVLENGTLVLRGEKKEELQKKEGNVQRSEIVYGKFERRLDLPAEVDLGKIEAVSRKGILTVTLPKTEKAKVERKKVPVKMGQ